MVRESWTEYLLNDNNQHQRYSRPGRTIFIRENDRNWQYLPQHALLPDKKNKNNVYLMTKVAEMDGDLEQKVFIPLIPGYCIYTKLGETFFKFNLEWSTEQNKILYRWTDYASDSSFTNIRQTQIAYDLNNLRKYITNTPDIKYTGTISITFLLGFTCKSNVQSLRGFISHNNPTLFQMNGEFYHAEKKRDKLLKQVKRKSQEIQQDLYFDDLNNGRIIKDGLPILANGWQGSQIIQAMGVKLVESQNQINEIRNELKVTKKRLRRSLDTIHKLNNQLKSDSESSEDELEEDNVTSDTNEFDTNSIIQNLIQKSKLGSTILISTDVFLQLISNQPCIICHDTNSSNRKFKIKTNGLGVQVDVKCRSCSNSTEYHNEQNGQDFSKCITGAGLIGGVNREELRSILAFLGITKQNGHQQYYNKEVCDYLQNKGQDLLEVSFDCAWSHVREASQASGEFIFNGELEGYEHRPILAFHVVEKKREYQNQKGNAVIIQKGNYDKSSQQMEHAILIAIVEKITTIIEEYNIKLNVGVDGDLTTNKTLGLLNIVNQIFADLKHKAKLVRSKIASDRNWKHLEQQIMKYYTRCVYAAASRANNPDISTPTDAELAWMHTVRIVQHLRGNHEKCWPEVCWIVENPDLILPTPNLVDVNEDQCLRLVEFLKRITKLKDDQSLITTIRTSYNEAFNRLKLNYTEKKTDYPKSFKARHALSVIHNNNGFVDLQRQLRKAGDLPQFSLQDENNLLKIWKHRDQKRKSNIMAIEKRNQTRAEKIINQKKNLETFDFTQDLVPYGRQVHEEINKSKFIPSFANLVPSFKTSCLKCIGCQSFAKKYSSGLCNLCGFLLKNNLPSSLPKLRNQQASSSSSSRELAISSIVQFFGFERYRELQCESIESFLSGQNTLTILRTGGGKSLIYAAASILSQALTVVFTPQKSLMDDQVREMVKFGIPAAMLYASSEQSPQVQEKIVSEIASGLIRILFITPEKYVKNLKFRNMLQNISTTRGLQFVIDEAHCIISYEGFRDSWHQLKCIKQDFPSIPLLALTATCSPEDAAKIETVLERPNMKVIRSPIIHRQDIALEVQPKPIGKKKLYQAVFNLLDNHEGRVIIFSATIQHCIDITDELRKAFDPSIVAMYHGKMSSSEQTATSNAWKNGIIKIMSATSAFGMGINVSDVTLIIHTTLPLSNEQYVQEIGRAGRLGQGSKAIMFYSRGDIRTLLAIIGGGQEK
ncbi:unnamed protein product [Rhizophagus irregularis]|nr:unnamed protein product [Rhizophagus irregularis]